MTPPPTFATLLQTLAGLSSPTFDEPVRSALQGWTATDVPSHIGPVLLMLDRLPLPGAAVASIWLGSCVENGADPARALPVLRQVLLRHLERTDLDDADDDTLSSLQWLAQGIVAHLLASPEGRAEWAANEALCDALEAAAEDSVGAMWLDELLGRRSGRVVVVHADEPWAYWAEVREVGNLFALFTLLQDALPFERGDRMTAWFHYQHPSGGSTAQLGASVWGEGSLDSLERVDGVPVVVCHAPLLGQRGWDEGFLGPAFESAPTDVSVTPCTPEETALWRGRLSLPSR